MLTVMRKKGMRKMKKRKTNKDQQEHIVMGIEVASRKAIRGTI